MSFSPRNPIGGTYGEPRRPNQKILQHNDHLAPLTHVSKAATPSARTAAGKPGSIQQNPQQQKLSSSTYQPVKEAYNDSHKDPGHHSAAGEDLFRGIGDHLHADPAAAQAHAYIDQGPHMAGLDTFVRQEQDLYKLDPMERFLQESPSDQPALVVDPVTGQLSYRGGHLQRLERRNY